MTETTGAQTAATSTVGQAVDFIAFNKIAKSYGANRVLDDLSFGVGSGERITLIGPSGSGKTTILRILMTLVHPDSGTIKVGDDHLYHEQRNGSLVQARDKHIT